MDLNISLKYNVYCFDIFDTILARKVAPEYVKEIWAKEIKDYFDISMLSEDIYKLRNKIEADLCQKNVNEGKDLEFQLDSLYSAMYNHLNLNMSEDKAYFMQISYSLEMSIEKRVQELCPDVVNFIKKLKQNGKRVVCISDFYTPVGFIKGLFAYHHILDYIDDFYISSQYLMTKRSGRLYDIVLSKLEESQEKIIMIGDNHFSDYELPISKGISAFWLDRSERYSFYNNFNKEKKVEVDKGLYQIYNKVDRDSYEDISFALYQFIQKLYNKVLCKKIKHVFFLSREGEFLKKIFDLYQENRIIDAESRISTHYLMVSRKATFIASLKKLDEENFEMIFRQYINISLFDFLSSLGFEEKEQLFIGKDIGIDIYKKQDDLPNNEIFKTLLGSQAFQDLYEQKRIEQKNNFSAYLNSFGVDFERDEFCIVDVGWKGTIQDNIFMFFEQKRKILGLYLGLVAPGKKHPMNIKEGLVFSNIDGVTRYFDVYNANKSIFEVILGASHGSADHYLKQDNNIIVVTSERDEERELFKNVIRPMQVRIEKIFRDIDAYLINYAYDYNELVDVFADIHARLVYKPTQNQIDLFYRLYHFENFGVFEFTKFKTKDNVSLSDRFSNLKRLLIERRGFFATSFWGIIALYDAGLSFLIFPYGIYMYKHFYLDMREK